MAELADAHGSGPCEGNFMEVRILLSAPIKTQSLCSEFFLWDRDYYALSSPFCWNGMNNKLESLE